MGRKKDPNPKVRVEMRIEPELHQLAAEAAKEALRSLNAEIRHRLKTSFERDQASA